jgi:hypothetical protein
VATSPPPLRFAFRRCVARQTDEYASMPSAATLQCSMHRFEEAQSRCWQKTIKPETHALASSGSSNLGLIVISTLKPLTICVIGACVGISKQHGL